MGKTDGGIVCMIIWVDMWQCWMMCISGRVQHQRITLTSINERREVWTNEQSVNSRAYASLLSCLLCRIKRTIN